MIIGVRGSALALLVRALLLDRLINHPAQIVAYANEYVLLIMATVPAWLLLFMMRLPRKAATTAPG